LQELRETTDKLCAMARDLDQKKGALNELKMEHELMQNAVSVKSLATNKGSHRKLSCLSIQLSRISRFFFRASNISFSLA